jgi:hypothetical protein
LHDKILVFIFVLLSFVKILCVINQSKTKGVESMKFIKKSIAVMATMGLLLFACSPEKVAPTDGNQNGGPSIAGALDAHPDLEIVCSAIDTITIWSEDGSSWCNKCYDMFGGPRDCDAQDSATSWGNVVFMNGLDSIDTDNDSMYDAAENIFVANISMSAGWFIVASKSQFSTGNNWIIQNGIIQIQNDWLGTNLNPYENAWQLRKRVAELPTCFDIALNLQVLSLDLFSLEIAGSNTSCWGRNPHWNQPTHHSYVATSPFLTHFCPASCTGTPPQCPADNVCEVVYSGLPCNNGSTVLTPSITGVTGPFTYNWSNGLTTSSITVSPTVTTTYTVTVSNTAGCVGTVNFNVNVVDASCNITSSNGGGGSGHGNGGGGSHHGSDGSGSNQGSGSHHRPGCTHNHNTHQACNNGNHRYGCNASHSGGNNNCNHRGHGYHCTRNHPANRSCNGGHTRGCDGNHAANASCQTRGGHKYNCNGQHSTGNCNTSVQHTQSCNRGNHTSYAGCNNGHSHSHHGNGSGRGAGSGTGGGHGTGHANGSGHCGSNGGGGQTTTTPGVKICHVPPGNPGGAATVCIPVGQLNSHVTGVCSNGGGNGGNGGSGSNNHGSGSGSNNHGSGSGSNNHGSGSGSNNHGGNNGGGNCNNGGGSNHGGGQGSNHGGSGSGHCSGHTSNHGGACQGNTGGGHPGDRIGACGTNPCN